jgi:putative membrane protein
MPSRFLLPLGLVSTLAWWTPFVCAVITFLFIAIDSIGSNIEDPFENRIHDVPLSTLCRTIEININADDRRKTVPGPDRADVWRADVKWFHGQRF